MISRRSFLKVTGAAALTLATGSMLTACSGGASANEPAAKPNDLWITPTGNTVELEKGVTLTILKTKRESVLPGGTLQYLGVTFKLDNDTDQDVEFAESNFVSKIDGVWVSPVTSEKLSDAQINFLTGTCDTPYIGYYDEYWGSSFGTAGTALEAAVCYMTTTEAKSLDLYVLYGKKTLNYPDPVKKSKHARRNAVRVFVCRENFRRDAILCRGRAY